MLPSSKGNKQQGTIKQSINKLFFVSFLLTPSLVTLISELSIVNITSTPKMHVQQISVELHRPALQTLPIYKLPGVGQIPHDLHGDQHLLFNVDCANHLVQELACVGQELTHLQVRLQLVELLYLNARQTEEALTEKHQETYNFPFFSYHTDEKLATKA